MSLICPRCNTVQPQENHHCAECGITLPKTSQSSAPTFRFAEPVLLAEEAKPTVQRSPPEAFQPTVLLSEVNLPGIHPPKAEEAESDVPRATASDTVPLETPMVRGKQPAAWKVPALLALAGLAILGFALAGAARIVSQTKRAPGPPAASVTVSLSPAFLSPPKPTALPLTVLLQSAATGRHNSVGSPVVITAFAMLGPGQSAALALSCKPERGRRTMFSFAEGRLCSANWTPSAPGRYQFTATALDAQCHFASARPLWITVDDPKRTARAAPASVVPEAIAPLPVSPLPLQFLPVIKVSPSLSEWRSARVPRIARHYRKSRVLAALPLAASIPSPVLNDIPSLTVSPILRPPALYHVVAASFRFPGNAAILARALRARGLFAITNHGMKHGKATYVVEVGSYPLPDEAQKKTLELQRRGYPAYIQH